VSRRTAEPSIEPRRGRAATRAGLWLAPLLLGVACVPQNAAYEDIRSLVARTGHDLRWRHLDARDTTKEVRALMSAPLTSDGAVKLALLNNADLAHRAA
jgi:hypothetical protein